MQKVLKIFKTVHPSDNYDKYFLGVGASCSHESRRRASLLSTFRENEATGPRVDQYLYPTNFSNTLLFFSFSEILYKKLQSQCATWSMVGFISFCAI